MRNYNRNVKNYLSEEVLGTETYQAGDEIGWTPFEETEANFCYLDSIKSEGDAFVMTLRVENEFTREKYTKDYTVKKDSEIELNTYEAPLMCFLPPEKVPVLVKIQAISADSVSLQTVGVLEEYAGDVEKQKAGNK